MSRETGILKFGGEDFQFYFPDQPQDEEALKTGYLSTSIPGNFFSSLAKQSYTEPYYTQLKVLSSLSPVSLANNLWTSNVVNLVLDPNDLNYVYYLNSGLGIQSAFDHRACSILSEINKTYLNLNSNNLRISEQAHRDNFTSDRSVWINSEKIPSIDKESLVIWAGIEDIKPETIQEVIDNSPKGTSFILQSSDDHDMDIPVTNHLGELSKYFNTDPLFLGKLKSSYGTRFMVAF